jgi:hypothetical protein
MSDTPKLADECKKLLDNGWQILLFRNELGSYTAEASKPALATEVDEVEECHLTDDFEPSQALYRLTEKVLTGRVV